MSNTWIGLGLLAGALALSVAAGPIFAAAKNAGASDEVLPEFTGMWSRTGEPMFEPIPGSKDGPPVARLEVDHPDAEEIMAGNADNPMLLPWAHDIVKKNAEKEVALEHVFQADDSCWPVTVPAILNMREAVQVIQGKDRITILYQRDHQFRQIWLNQKHRANVKPSWYGESVGHFEGDTLVVDTTRVKTHEMSLVDPFGTPHTDKLHVVERYRLIEDKVGKGMEVTIRVEDAGTFAKPWAGRLTYRPNAAKEIVEVICSENNRDFEGKPFGPLPVENANVF